MNKCKWALSKWNEKLANETKYIFNRMGMKILKFEMNNKLLELRFLIIHLIRFHPSWNHTCPLTLQWYLSNKKFLFFWQNIGKVFVFSSENSTNFGNFWENSLDFRYHKIGGKKKPCMTCPSTTGKGEKKQKIKRKKTRVYLEPENISGCRLLSFDLCDQQVRVSVKYKMVTDFLKNQ